LLMQNFFISCILLQIRDILIRNAKESDVEQVYNVLMEMISSEDNASMNINPFLMDLRNKRSDFVDSAKKELIKEFNEENSAYLVAEINNKIIGYIRGSVVENEDPFFNKIRIGYLNALVVLKEYSGKGIASKLNNELETWFKENDCKQIHLEVFDKNPAINMYEK